MTSKLPLSHHVGCWTLLCKDCCLSASQWWVSTQYMLLQLFYLSFTFFYVRTWFEKQNIRRNLTVGDPCRPVDILLLTVVVVVGPAVVVVVVARASLQVAQQLSSAVWVPHWLDATSPLQATSLNTSIQTSVVTEIDFMKIIRCQK